MNNDDILTLKGKILQILTHFLAWLIFLALLFYLVPKPLEPANYAYLLVPNILFIALFYLNYHFLVPRLFIPRKYLLYGLICFWALVLTTILPSFFFETLPMQPGLQMPPPNMPPEFGGTNFGKPDFRAIPQPFRIISPNFSYTFFVFALVMLISLGMRITRQWQQAEKEKINAELDFLKAQINPHFLFNTLNNIHSMVINNSEKTSEAIEVFSDLMRFVIFETRNNTVPVSDKIQYISNYITLQRMRLPANVEVNFNVEGNPYQDHIAPMILMPFIENAFKYGVSTENESVINIRIEIKNHELLFSIKNLKFKHSDFLQEVSQLGIGNTQKRLNLIYPGRHKLDITETESEYKVSLQINLK